MTQPQKHKYMVPAVLRAFDIIELIAEHGRLSLMSVCRMLDLPKTSAYQILNTLCERGYLLFSSQTGTYSLSLRFFGLGNRSLLEMDIRMEALPLMYALMEDVKQTCHLAILEGAEAVYLAKAFMEGSTAVNSWVGKRLNLQTTAMGRILLAWRPAAEAMELLQSNPPMPLTPHTILEPALFMDDLAVVRQRGWAEEKDENRLGMRCIAAPVREITGTVIAAIGISGSTEGIRDDCVENLARKVCLAAGALSERLSQNQSRMR